MKSYFSGEPMAMVNGALLRFAGALLCPLPFGKLRVAASRARLIRSCSAVLRPGLQLHRPCGAWYSRFFGL